MDSLGQGATLYTRQATGLVREIGMSSNLALNISFISLPLAVLVATQAPFAFPGSNLIGIVIITALLCIIPTLLYGSLSQAMPRSGGDYVFVSRIIHPLIGFVANFSVTMWFQLVIAYFGALLAPFGLSAALSTMGAATGNQSLTDMATTVTGKEWQFALGAIVLILTAALMSLDLRRSMRVFQWIFWLSLVGVVIAAFLTLVNGREQFVAAVAGMGGNYDQMIADAKAAGFTGANGGIDWNATIAATPLAFASFGYAIVTTYAGGEVRSARTTMLRGLLWALGISAVIVLILLALAARTFGQDWLGSSVYLANNVPDKYLLPSYPFYFFFAAMLTNNAILIAIMSISFVLAFFAALPPTFLIATRSLFAWSFDRILPDKVSEVNDRTHSPVWANVIVLVITLIFLVLIVYGPGEFLTLLFTAGAAEIMTFIIVAIAAAVFPYRRREMWEASPINQRFMGIPRITLIGVASVVVYLIFLIPLLTNDTLGANAAVGLWATAILFALPFAIYAISYFWNKSRGVDLSLAFESLPPE
ncbi:MAG: APC family permease [Chloroflexi bacterium]|nr:APC family permease [Chloroflexota bacterium]